MSQLTDRMTAERSFRLLVQEEAEGRVCRKCGGWRDRDEFAPGAWNRASSGGSYICRPCKSYENRVTRLEWRYGLTEQAYDAIFVGQGGVCAICKSLPVPKNGRPPLVVDHDHQTGVVRGLLCDKCNVSLGRLGDTVESIENVLRYVRGTWR